MRDCDEQKIYTTNSRRPVIKIVQEIAVTILENVLIIVQILFKKFQTLFIKSMYSYFITKQMSELILNTNN